jgi:hypothetical protein
VVLAGERLHRLQRGEPHHGHELDLGAELTPEQLDALKTSDLFGDDAGKDFRS